MSILRTIKSTIVKQLSTSKWVQVSSDDAGDSSRYRKIQDSEITPEIWFGVASGDNVISNLQFAKYKDNDGDAIVFVDDFYDFDGMFTAGATIDESDVKWLLGEGAGKDNRVFTTDVIETYGIENDITYSIWGVPSSSTYWAQTLGIMDILKGKSYSQSVAANGISSDEEIVTTFLKELSKLEIDKGTENSFSTYWKTELENMKRSLLASKRDLAEIIDRVPKGFYSLDTFAKKISIATSFILEYGEFTNLGNLQESLYLDEGGMTLKEYTAGSAEQQQLQALGLPLDNTTSNAATRTEQEIANDYTEDSVRYIEEEVWQARINGDYIYASGRGNSAVGAAIQFMTSNYNNWLTNIDKDAKDVKEINYGALDANDKEIVDFLTGTGEFKSIIKASSARWLINDDPVLKLSNKVGGEPRNVQTYESEILLFLDKDRNDSWDFQGQVIDDYYDFALAIKAGNLKKYTNPDGEEVFSLTKEMDKRAFELADLIAETVVANRVNDLKARLFINLEDLINPDKDDDKVLQKAIAANAQQLNSAGNLGYEEDEISQKEIADRQKLLEQCALLLNLKEIDNVYNKNNFDKSEEPTSKIHKTGYFDNRFLRMQGNIGSRTITSLYAQRESAKAFLEMNPVMQGLLSPKIKIQKVVVKDGITHTIDVPFTAITTGLDSKTPIDYVAVMKETNSVFRGGGVGIKSISFDFDGETPATAQKWVRSTMSLKFQDFADLVNTRSTTKITSDNKLPVVENDFRFIDLIVNSVENPNVNDGYDAFFRDHYKATDYKIKIEVGWNYQKTQATKDLIQSQLNIYKIGEEVLTVDDFFNAVDKQNKTFLFAALDHDININDDGSIDLNINYFGYPDALLNSYKFNALVTRQEEDELKKELDSLFDLIKDGRCNSTQLSKLQAAIETKRQIIIKGSQQSLIARLTKKKILRSVTITDKEQIAQFKLTGAFSKKPIISTNLSAGYNKEAGQTKQFFLLGDLFYVLMDCMYEGNSRIDGTENISFILTDFEFTSLDDEKVQINLASIPIALDFFKEWYTEEVISSERYNYPIMEFILVLVNRLVGDILTEVCFNKKPDKTLFFRQAQMFGSEVQNDYFKEITNFESTDSFQGIINIESSEVKGFLPLSYDSSTGGGAHEMYTFIAIYPDFKPDAHLGKGNYTEDLGKGIYHFHIGSATGLLKKVSFSKTNITYLRESRMMRYRGLGDFAQLSNVYNVSMEMFGNFLFFPGMQIFIDPFGIGGKEFGRPQENLFNATTNTINYAKLMGIGGYHLVTSVKTTIGVDGFKTQVEARYFFSGDTDGNDATIDGLIRRRKEAPSAGVPDDGTDTQSCNTIISTFETNTIEGGND